MSELRIAHVVGKMVGGGVESMLMNYYRRIDHGSIQFDFLVDDDSTAIPAAEISSLGGRIYAIGKYQNQAEYQRRLRRVLRQGGWRIVHSHINALSVFPLSGAALANIPVRIAHSHTSYGTGEPVRNAVKRTLRPFVNTVATHRFACSAVAGKWLFGKESYELIYNAFEVPTFAYSPEARRIARMRLGIEEDQYVIGHIGRMVRTKNQEFLLRAMKRHLARNPRDVLCLVGEGGMRTHLEIQAESLGISHAVRIVGHRNAVQPYLSAFDLFVLPSLYEGLGMAAVEAQAAGLPCIVSNRVPREVDVTGRVRFVGLDDPERWIEAIEEARADISSTARLVDLHQFRNYDIARQATRLERLYLAVASGCGTRLQ